VKLACTGKETWLALPALALVVLALGCTKTANPDRTPNQISNNVPRADAAYTNRPVPTNQLQTNR